MEAFLRKEQTLKITRRWLYSFYFLLASYHGVAAAETRPQNHDRAGERAGQELAELFEASDEARLALDPLGSLGRGDLRFAADFGDYVTSGHFSAIAALARDDLKRLAAIDRDKLSPLDQISFDVFRYQQGLSVREFDSGMTEIQRRLPLDQLFGYHVTFPDMSSGENVAPFNTLVDYENGLRRLRGFVTYLNRAESAMREGIVSGHVQPRFVTVLVLEQLRETLAKGVEDSPFLAPTRNIPQEIGAEDAARLERSYREVIADAVLPAYAHLERFMDTVYLPASRTKVPGLVGLPDGDKLYRALIQRHTGLTLSADAIHQIGLDEVARIRQEMESIMAEVDFQGTLQEFFDFLRTDSKFKFATRESLLAAYEAVWQQLEPSMSTLFSGLPRTPFEIRPVPETLEKTAAGAYYVSGTPDGSRPGIFYVNTFDLATRTSPTLETLFLHEALPGHHLQASLTQENESLPAFLRFGWDTAFIEGWGLYAESLGPELGLFQDPYQRFGHLDLEMFRALRLVVDTGLHAKGWSRQHAVDFMGSHSSLNETVLKAEVDRYVVWPGQALAYKLGQIAIRNLRNEAHEALGDDLDLRAFHDQILGSGAIPIPILETKVRAWIEQQARSL